MPSSENSIGEVVFDGIYELIRDGICSLPTLNVGVTRAAGAGSGGGSETVGLTFGEGQLTGYRTCSAIVGGVEGGTSVNAD